MQPIEVCPLRNRMRKMIARRQIPGIPPGLNPADQAEDGDDPKGNNPPGTAKTTVRGAALSGSECRQLRLVRACGQEFVRILLDAFHQDLEVQM